MGNHAPWWLAHPEPAAEKPVRGTAPRPPCSQATAQSVGYTQVVPQGIHGLPPQASGSAAAGIEALFVGFGLAQNLRFSARFRLGGEGFHRLRLVDTASTSMG
jgi:hypothetical protein